MYCFTRNFEDVVLQRVLAGISHGCYLDIGASNPVDDSNTFAFYLKGWRGVVVEPLPYDDSWQLQRSEDIFLNVGVGAKPGDLTLNIYDSAQQISTGSADTVAHWRHHGITPTSNISVPMLTLNQIISEYIPDRPIHLLSIDVEGMEYEVLKGMSFQDYRPWVLILEATLPGSPVQAHHEWEPLILNQRYQLAYFDGVNRFYLAQEQSHLLERFVLPPNMWDDFITLSQLKLEVEVRRLRARVANTQSGYRPESGQTDLAEMFKQYGNTLLELCRRQEAEQAYRQALRLNPLFAEAHNNLGNLLRMNGSFAAAKESLDRANELLPDSAEIYNNYGILLYEMGQLEGAEEMCRKAIILKADYDIAYLNRGNILHALGRQDTARKCFLKACELNPELSEKWSPGTYHNTLTL